MSAEFFANFSKRLEQTFFRLGGEDVSDGCMEMCP
jgi:hypothetical protein